MMNLKQAMAALALGLKVRRVYWTKEAFIHIYESEIIDESGSICWTTLSQMEAAYKPDYTNKWEIFNAQETNE